MALTDYRQALLDLLNVARLATLGDLKRAAEAEPGRAQNFIDKYGPLRSMGTTEASAEITVTAWSHIFRESLAAQINAPEQHELLNKAFMVIFNDPVGEQLTSVRPDVVAGTVEVEPRDLLDAMANEVLRSRKSIARCAQCSRFFFRQYSHDKYCSLACGSEARRKGQKDWVAQKREAAKQLHKKGRKAS